MIYLDANATEPLRPQARDVMLAALDLTGNPASAHRAGRAARAVLDRARRVVADLLGVSTENCVFTSGGTEANVLAVRGLGQGRRLLLGATEHDAVRQAPPADADVEWIAVTPDGQLDLADLERKLVAGEGDAFVCVMLANNETGVIHPIAEIARLCRKAGARLHVDAVQGVGRLPVDIATLGADSLALSGHKFGGPKGAGALVLAGESAVVLPPVQAGGGQERGRRGGTPPLPAIAGLAAALDVAVNEGRDLSPMRDRLEAVARENGAVVCGQGAPRLGNTSCLALPGLRRDSQLIALDLAGFCVSTGAACSSGKVTGSHVLHAMGQDDLADYAIRVSLPWNVTEADVDSFIEAYARLAERHKNA
ncbi:cysteine desulfurase family protein [Acetobacter estunensis]|uniref:cysteine desulfurase family protein n=1 Tax=Acetobacter estunensis TaxID=104097 RepID=UPI001C2DE353|nr:cysteine desulfurase [Acetobacter estunensis]